MNSKKTKKDHGFLRLLKLVLPYKVWIFLSLVSMIGYNVFSAAPAYYTKDIIDSLEQKPDLDSFFLVSVGLVLVFGMKGVCHFFQTFSMGLMVQRLLNELRQQLFVHIQKLSLAFFTRSKTGDLISRFTTDTQTLQAALNVGITGPFRDIPRLFLLLAIMLDRSWRLTLLTLAVIPVAALCIQLFGRRNKRAVSARQESFGELASLLLESMTGVRVVKAFGMEHYEIGRFSESNDKLYRHNMKSILITSYSSPIIEIIGAIAGATILAYGGYLVVHDVITIGALASFLVSFLMMNDPAKQLNGFNLKLQEGLAALQRIHAILDTDVEIHEKPNAHSLERFEKEIVLDIRSFQYDSKGTPALENFKMTVQKGEVIALVGSSGAGKSTLINLIPRFYDVTEGSIRIDGYDIRDVNLRSLRQLIAIVTQDTILFNDTITNNISYGHPECPEALVTEAAEAANAHDFILNQKEGYNTLIGEKGVLLSGGQRQRLSIARAILKDAPILILDEATSALDSESEIAVQQALEHLMENRTTFVIAHRLSTIRHADRICVLEQGQIVEIGDHDTLLAQNGRYKQLYDLQFREQTRD